VDARQQERLKVGRAVLDALRHQDFRTELSMIGAGGDHVLIPVLPDDTMGIVFDELRENPGPVYLLLQDKGGLAVISCRPVSHGRHAAKESDDDSCPIHRDTQISMVRKYLREYGQLVCREQAPEVTVELINDLPDCAPAGA